VTASRSSAGRCRTASIDEEIRRLIESAHDEAWDVLVEYRDVLDQLVLRLLEKETVSRDEVLRLFAPVQKRPSRGSYTGYGKRLPSDRPPVLTPKELALTAAKADGQSMALPANGTNGAAGPASSNGQQVSFDNEPRDIE
jgi:cell division protease FtsH